MSDSEFEYRRRAPAWQRCALLAAGVYNIVWGSWALFFPHAVFDIFELARPVWPQVWQCLGMVIGVYGVGYLIAARDPLRHWPIVLVGMLGKVFGPIGFVFYAMKGDFPWSWGVMLVFNDLIWWWPFGAILIRTIRPARAIES